MCKQKDAQFFKNIFNNILHQCFRIVLVIIFARMAMKHYLPIKKTRKIKFLLCDFSIAALRRRASELNSTIPSYLHTHNYEHHVY